MLLRFVGIDGSLFLVSVLTVLYQKLSRFQTEKTRTNNPSTREPVKGKARVWGQPGMYSEPLATLSYIVN